MSDDEPGAAVRELATKLFEAARAERPGSALGRRLLMIQPRRDGLKGSVPTASGARADLRARARASSSWAVGVAAFALVAGGIGVFFWSERDAAVQMSPELGARRAAPVAVASLHGEATPAAPERLAGDSGELGASSTLVVEGSRDAAAAGRSPDHIARGATQPRPERARAGTRTNEARRPGTSLPPAPTSTIPSGASPSSPGLGPTTATEAAATSSEPISSAALEKPLALRDELELLTDARAALRSGDARHALELLDRHAGAAGASMAPSGLFAEATVLRIETLAALGRHDDARDLAARFVRDNPHSALGDRAKSFIPAAPSRAP